MVGVAVAMVVAMLLGRSLAGGRHQLGLHGFVGAAETSFKGEEVQPEHVEGGHAGGEETGHPEDRKAAEGLAQDFVLAPETGQGRDATDR